MQASRKSQSWVPTALQFLPMANRDSRGHGPIESGDHLKISHLGLSGKILRKGRTTKYRRQKSDPTSISLPCS